MGSFDLSIICVYNNVDQYEKMLASLDCQSLSIQVIGLDNRGGRWTSAASAYRKGIAEAEAPVLLFSHQDIVFTDNTFLEEFFSRASSNTNEIIGVAGAVSTCNGRGRHVISGMYQGSRLWRHHSAERPMAVETLDECLFGCNVEVFNEIAFDEQTCNGWHFYAVDLCLQAQLAGIGVTVIPANVIHESGGTRDASYYLAQEKIKAKYCSRLDVIPTTCGWTRTADIDPYRPIINDELSALRSAGVSYSLNFYYSLDYTFDLSNTAFFPETNSIKAAECICCCDYDKKLFDFITSSDKSKDVDSFDILIKINNFIAGKRWLYNDLIELKRDYPQAVERELRGSKRFQVLAKLFFWDVPTIDFYSLSRAAEHRLKKSTVECSLPKHLAPAEVEDIENLEEVLELAFSCGEEEFTSTLREIYDICVEWDTGCDDEAIQMIAVLLKSVCRDSHEAVHSIFTLKQKNDLLDFEAEIIRDVYSRSLPIRVGSLLARFCRRLPVFHLEN